MARILANSPSVGLMMTRVPPVSDLAIDSLINLIIESTSSSGTFSPNKIETSTKGGSIQAELALVLITLASGKENPNVNRLIIRLGLLADSLVDDVRKQVILLTMFT